MKKFLSIILAILMIVTMIPMAVLPASAATPTPYDGVPVTPQKISSGNYAKLGLTSSNWSQFNGYYAIRNAKELYGFAAVSRNSYTANAVLLQDIVVNANGSTTYDWTPIISSNPGYIYESIFDGNGHYISGLYSTVAIAASGGNNAKFGGFICRLGGTAKNLVIKNSTFAPCEDISTYGGVGAITGYPVSCTIQNCRVENITLKSINDGGQLGGIAGYGNGNSSTIKNCVSINVTFSGGIYTNSIAPKAPYSSCYTSATASHNCTNLSVEHKEVKATCEYPGLSNYKYCLVCGKVTSGTKTETPATGHTLKSATCVAPKTCTICGATEGSIDNTAHSWANNDGICANGCGATCAHKNQTGSACEICGAELHVCRNYDNGFCTECDAYEPAELNENGYYEISNAGQLFWYANYINTVDRTANAVLTEDIDLENRPWTPIGSTGENSNNFRGIFDGQNYIIRGLYVEGDRAGLGFFGEVRTGTVKNFTIYGEVVVNTEVDYVGGVIGSICGVNGETDLERNGAIIQNIKSFVNLTVKAHGVGKIGGFVGYANHESLIEKCSWYGTFDAGEYRVDNGAGGFIGRIQENSSEVTIRNCGAYGTIKTNYAGDYNDTATIYMGGFLSFSNTNAKTVLENCLFAGRFKRGEKLTDQAFLGAFGTLRSVKAIKNCYYLGDDGLEAVHSDSNLKPGSDNVEITKATGEELKKGTVAKKLGEYWEQGVHYPTLKDHAAHWGSETYGYTDNGDGTHDMVCTGCGYVEVDNEAHTPADNATYTDNNDGTHSSTCAVCGAIVAENHSFTDGTCTACGVNWFSVSGNTLTIDGTLGYKTEVTEEDITVLVNKIQDCVDSGITTIIVTGSEPALHNFYGIDTSAVSAALYYLADGRSDSPYCGTIDLILPDVTEIVDDEFNNTFALNSITLPKVTKLGDLAFYACRFIQTIAFGSVVTDVEEGGGVMFHMVGYDVGGCDLVLNCGQMDSTYIPDIENNTWTFRYENEFKSIALTHTEGTAATCTELAVCSVCGESYGEVDADGHDWSNTDGVCTVCENACPHENVTGATCITSVECDVCGYSVFDWTNHEGEYVTVWFSDYQHVSEYECCHIESSVVYEDHKYENYTEITPADCVNNAWEMGKCICGDIHIREIAGSAKNHDWSNLDGVCANGCGEVCTHEKYTDGVCDKCGYECAHTWDEDGYCRKCKTFCKHENNVNGVCTVCDYVLTFSVITGETVSYYDRFDDALENAEEGSTVKLMKGINIIASYEINKSITFDLNGNSWDTGSSDYIDVYTFVTFTDSVGTGSLNLSLNLYAPCLFNSGSYKGIGIMFETEDTLDDYLAECHGFFDHYTGEFKDVSDEKYVMGAKVDVYHKLGAQTCKGYQCEECGEYFGEADPDAHDWSNKDGICVICGEECTHNYGEGVLTRPVYDAVLGSKDGYYTYTCTVCGKEKKEAVKGADYSAYDAVSEEINGLLQSDDLTPEAKQAIYSAANECGLLSNDLTESEQNIVDSLVAELEKIVADADEKIASGEYVKADYTAIDEAIKAVENKLTSEYVTDEGKAELEEIKTQLEEMKADTNTSKADLAELETALDEYEEELDKGIEDGTLVKFSGERVFLELAEEAEKKIDEKYGENAFYDFANENRDSFYNLYDKYFFRAASLEGGTMAENAENTEYIKGMVDELFGMAENCLAGTHNYGEGVLTRPTFESEGYYTYTCTLCGHSYTEPAKEADTTALNDASMKVTEYIDNDTLTQEARDGIYKSYRDILKNNGNLFDEFGFVRGDLVEEDQPAIDAITAELEKIIADAEEKIASGEYVKADYTEIDEAIDDIEEKLASENVTDEGKAELEEIKKQLEEMKADENTSAADVAELEKALEDYEEELDKGIEDGTLVEIDVYKIGTELSVRWTERLEAEGLLDEREDFVNNQKYTDEAVAVSEEIEEFLASLEGTVAENAENIAKLNEMFNSFTASFENCLRGTHNFNDYEVTSPAKCEVNAIETRTCWFCGETDEREVEGTALTHSFTKYEETEEAKCGVAGKEVAYCDHGCGEADEREVEGTALEHVFGKYTSNGDATCTADGTKTAECIHGCGETDTVADEGSMIDHSDEDGDKLCDDCQSEIIDTCPDCGGPAHEDTGVPMYICIIITFIRLLISFIKAIS